MTDRAAVVATTITAIVTEALRDWLRNKNCAGLPAIRKEIESYLRGEFDECARAARADLELKE